MWDWGPFNGKTVPKQNQRSVCFSDSAHYWDCLKLNISTISVCSILKCGSGVRTLLVPWTNMFLLRSGCWVWFHRVASFSISVHMLIIYITCTLLCCVFHVSAWACFIRPCDNITSYLAWSAIYFIYFWPLIIALVQTIRAPARLNDLKNPEKTE